MAKRRRTLDEPVKDIPIAAMVDVVRSPYEQYTFPWADSGNADVPEAVPQPKIVLIDSMIRYQITAMRTRGDFGDESSLMVFSALEIAAEAGEVANLVYKRVFQGHPLDKDKIVEELGDVLWGIASLADAIGISLHAVAEGNIAKLARRYPDGRFSTEQSIARKDHG